MVDLFAPMQLRPVLTDEECQELETVEAEAHVVDAVTRVVDELCPYTPTYRRKFDRVLLSDRAYIVAKDGSFRRMPGPAEGANR